VFAFQDTQDRVEIAFTDRHGGTSGGPFASLNLSPATGDDAEAVARNLDLVGRSFAGDRALRRLVLMHQVHGAGVHVVGEDDLDAPHPPVVDALVTDLPGVALVVRVADCVPVLLADPEAGVVGAAHAGRPGLVAGVVPRAVQGMRDLGARRITAWIGPHVCGACYEVPEQLRADVAAVVPEAFGETSWGTPAVDVGAGVLAQLAAEGIEAVDASRCTLEDRDLYSFRRQGTSSGRLAGLVAVWP
jgi:YfiH family protein